MRRWVLVGRYYCYVPEDLRVIVVEASSKEEAERIAEEKMGNVLAVCEEYEGAILITNKR